MLHANRSLTIFNVHLSRTAVNVVLAFLICLYGQVPAQAQDVLGGLTLGAFLNKALDQVDQEIRDAQNAGNAVEIEAGRETALAIQNAQNAYADSLDKTAKDLNQSVLTTVGQLQDLTNAVSKDTSLTVKDATTRVQTIANSLPFAGKEPQVTSVRPPYVVPKDDAPLNDLEIIFEGNFPNSSLAGYAAYLKVGGRTFKGENQTGRLRFLVPQGALFADTANRASGLQLAHVSLVTPWQQDKFFGLIKARREDHFDVLIGSLPATPGTISVIHTVTGSVPVVKDFCGGPFHQASTKEASNNDDKDHHWLVTPESGWHVVRNTSHAKMRSIQGDVGLPSLISDDGDRVVYTATTIHHGFGSAGSMDFSICFKETQDQATIHADTQLVPLKWGDSKVFDYAAGSWKVSFIDFTGKSTEFSGPDNKDPFITISEPGGKLSIKASDPDSLNWP